MMFIWVTEFVFYSAFSCRVENRKFDYYQSKRVVCSFRGITFSFLHEVVCCLPNVLFLLVFRIFKKSSKLVPSFYLQVNILR